MHNTIRMGYLGLEDREVRVLKSIFALSPQMKEHYVLTGSSELDKADMVLVNAGNPKAVSGWNKISQVNKLATPIALSATDNTIAEVIPLKLPIRLPKLIKALEEALEDYTQSNFEVEEIPRPGTNLKEMPLLVLVVDDSFPVRKYMEQKLTELFKVPARISFAASGEEAMLKLEEKSYDMVFLDVMMDGVDGYKVCREIKSGHSSYVVMLTSKKSPFDKVRGTMSGCDAFITKPPTDERLVEEINKGIRHRAKNQRL